MNVKVSKRTLLVEVQPVLETHRLDKDRQISATASRLEQALVQILGSHPILESKDRREELVHLIIEANIAWNSAKQAAIRTGKLLLRIHRSADDVYNRIVEGGGILPHKSVESKLRRIAESVIENRFQEDELPQSYNTAYELVLLSDSELQHAREIGLVRPDVQRAEIQKFKERLNRERPIQPLSLARARRRLERKRQELMADLVKIDEELRRIDALIRPQPAQQLSSSCREHDTVACGIMDGRP